MVVHLICFERRISCSGATISQVIVDTNKLWVDAEYINFRWSHTSAYREPDWGNEYLLYNFNLEVGDTSNVQHALRPNYK